MLAGKARGRGRILAVAWSRREDLGRGDSDHKDADGMSMRTESDSIGDIEVAAEAYWGAQTERSRHNFAFPAHERMTLPLVHALARIKGAAPRINRNPRLYAGLAEAIVQAADAAEKPRSGRWGKGG